MDNKQSNYNCKTVSWVRGKCIGKGSFGTVHTALDKSDGRVFAVKSVYRDTCLPGQIESLENEIRILRSVSSSSDHIVSFLGDDVSSSCRNLHLEYLPGGTVADLASCGGLDEKVCRRYTWCVVSALREVHARGIVHCDVKGRNILLAGTNSNSVKLADFGSAMEVNGFETNGTILPRGSPLWMAPEVVRREYQGPESDVWSLGCTIIEMLTGKPGWDDNGIHTLNKIGFSDELPSIPTRLSELGRDFLDKCLRKQWSQRWSCDQLLQHPFLSQNDTAGPDSSPRCVHDWPSSGFEEHCNSDIKLSSEFNISGEISGKDRISKLATGTGANWEIDGWVTVRDCSFVDARDGGEEERTYPESSNCTRVITESNEISSVYSDSLFWTSEGNETERTKREFLNYNNSGHFSRWRYCNISGVAVVPVCSAGGLRCGGGGASICRCGAENVGFVVDKLWIRCCYVWFCKLVSLCCWLNKLFEYFIFYSKCPPYLYLRSEIK